MKRQIIYIYMICATVTLSGCHIYKAYDRPKDIAVSGMYRDPYSAMDTLSADTVNMGNLPWEKVFEDTHLRTIIEYGLDNSTNLQVATLRVDEARAMLTSARLSYLPSLSLSPQGTISGMVNGSSNKTYQLPAVASWEIDLFGRLLNSKRGAKASLLQSDAYRQAVRSQLIANIANAYYTLLMLDAQLTISEETSKVWKENLRALEAMKEAGMTNEAAISRSKANSHQVEASLQDLRRQIRETENALSVMLGDVPHSIERGKLADQSLPTQLDAGIPIQMLANRPDIRYAEMQLAGAYYSTNQARSAFYPNLSLTGSLGWTNNAGGVVLDPAKWIYSAVGNLTQPIFNRGNNIARLKVAKAQQQEAYLNFQQSILNAGKEVSDALFLYESSSKKILERKAQVKALEDAVDYTNDLFYHSTGISYLEVLTAQQSLLSAQLNEASDTFQRMQAVVNLYQALGGGRD